MDFTKSLLGRDSKSSGVKERKTALGMARIVFNENTSFSIRKTWLADVRGSSVLVPKSVREDTTGRKHLTNDVSSGEMYTAGLLLTEPENGDWVRGTWRRNNTVKFRAYITQKNHITIPSEIRDEYNVECGDTIQIALTGRIFESSKLNQSHVPDWLNI